MRPLVLIAGLLLVHSLSPALNPDSLKQVAYNSPYDTARISALLELGLQIMGEQSDSALVYFLQAKQLVERVPNGYADMKTQGTLGLYYLLKGQHLLAMDHYMRALGIAEQLRNNYGRAVILFNLGQLYGSFYNIALTEDAKRARVRYLKECLELIPSIVDKPKEELLELEAAVHLDLGRAYLNSHNNVDSAEFHLKRAEAAFEQRGSEYSYVVLEELARVALRRHKYKEAVVIQQKFMEHLVDNNIKNRVDAAVLNYTTLALHFIQNKKFDSAEYYLNVATNTPGAGSLGKTDLYQRWGELFKAKGDYERALKAYTDLFELTNGTSSPTIKSVAILNMIECFKKLGQHERALYFIEMHNQQKDSLDRQNTAAKMANLQAQFMTSRKQAEIDQLSREAAIKDLSIQRNQAVLIGVSVALILVGAITIVVISRNRRIQRAKEEQRRAFLEVDQLKSRFFTNISHEFRTPLSLIIGPLERMHSTGNLQASQTDVTVMHKNAYNLLTLVNELLDLSRIDAGLMTLRLASVDLHELITNITSQFASIAISRQIKLAVELNIRSKIAADPDKLTKVINNLLANAFKFTPSGGIIEVRVNEDNDQVIIVVKDSGVGIAAKNLDKIFDRFYQVDDSATRQHEGSGIGLALARELVELHGGTIGVKSVLGEGTMFTVVLKRGNPDELPSATTQVATPVQMNDTHIQTDEYSKVAGQDIVLVVEDNNDLRKFIKRCLDEQYTVIEAEDGSAGWELATEHIPALILSDLMMPGVDGLTLCDKIKHDERTSHIPFVLLTAKAEVEARIKGYETGADDYVSKPFNPTELHSRINNLINGRKLLQAKFSRAIELRPSHIKTESLDERFLKKIMSIVETNMANSAFGVADFAKEASLSTTQLYRKLHALTGFTPNEFIRHIRLHRAKELLEQKAGNVSEVAYQVGFNNLSYFSKVFKEKFLVSPSDIANT